MKRTLITVVALTTWLAGCSRTATSQAQPEVKPSPVAAEAKKETFTCPMHPRIQREGPGSCPICGMALVKAGARTAAAEKQNTAPEGHASFHLTPERQQMIGVKLGTVEKKPLFKSIEAAGRIAFDPELYTAQNEYIEAVRQLERVRNSPIADVRHSAERMVESAKLRLKLLGLSDKQIARLRAGGSSADSLLLPKAGEKQWIYAEVFEMDLPSVQPGLSATIHGGSLEEELAGKVISVDRVINPTTRTAKVRIEVQDSKTILRPESYVDVEILSPLGEQVTVPFDAVLETGKEAWVFVAGAQGAFEPRKVTIKFRSGDQVAIGSGLQGGEKIVVSANFLIDSESRLKAVLEAPTQGAVSKTPECPEGEFWHAEMKHCMKKAGE